MEHCKGFEFDTVIIANANKNAIPKHSGNDSVTDSDSSNNEISKFYVAMTRAKTNLIISYSSLLTPFLDIPNREIDFNFTDSWGISKIEDNDSINIDFDEQQNNSSWKKMTGKEILFTESAIGLSRETQDKLIKIVTGKSVEKRTGNKTYVEEIINMDILEKFINNSSNSVHSYKLFGNNLQEVKELLSELNKVN